MARLVGKEMPSDLLRYLKGGTPGKFKDVILIASTDEGSFPHVAMLSHWEVVGVDRSSIRVATYADSHTTANLKRNGKITLIAVNQRLTYYVKGIARLVKEKMESDSSNSMFKVGVKEVYKDTLWGTKILTGITFSKTREAEPHEQLRLELVGG